MSSMRRLVFAFVLTFLWLPPVFAEPVLLKCRTQEGRDAANLIVDVENQRMEWGSSMYDIRRMNSEYLTGYTDGFDVGGEVFVIHRSTGEYWRAAVTAFCQDAECNTTKLGTGTYRGRCVRGMF